MTPTLKSAMTSHPHSVRLDATVSTAREMMASLHVHHLPVLDGGELVGVVSDRDLRLVDDESALLTVDDACVDDPVLVDVDTNLFVVAGLLADSRIGSVLVTERGQLAGIFTTTDACRVLAGLLHQKP